MNEIFYKALVGATAGGIMAAIIWVVQRARNGPPPPEQYREPMTRDEMIERLRAIVDDPDTSVAERQMAQDRLDAFSAREF